MFQTVQDHICLNFIIYIARPTSADAVSSFILEGCFAEEVQDRGWAGFMPTLRSESVQSAAHKPAGRSLLARNFLLGNSTGDACPLSICPLNVRNPYLAYECMACTASISCVFSQSFSLIKKQWGELWRCPLPEAMRVLIQPFEDIQGPCNWLSYP